MSIRVYECMYSHVHVLHILTGICTLSLYIYIYMSIYSHTHIGLRIEADGKHSLAVRRLEVISKFY